MTDRREPPVEEDGAAGREELGLSAAMAAVAHAANASSGAVSARTGTPNGQALAEPWPDVPGVFYPEPYVIDHEWRDRVPGMSLIRASNARHAFERKTPVGTEPVETDGAGLPAEIDEELAEELLDEAEVLPVELITDGGGDEDALAADELLPEGEPIVTDGAPPPARASGSAMWGGREPMGEPVALGQGVIAFEDDDDGVEELPEAEIVEDDAPGAETSVVLASVERPVIELARGAAEPRYEADADHEGDGEGAYDEPGGAIGFGSDHPLNPLKATVEVAIEDTPAFALLAVPDGETAADGDDEVVEGEVLSDEELIAEAESLFGGLETAEAPATPSRRTASLEELAPTRVIESISDEGTEDADLDGQAEHDEEAPEGVGPTESAATSPEPAADASAVAVERRERKQRRTRSSSMSSEWDSTVLDAVPVATDDEDEGEPAIALGEPIAPPPSGAWDEHDDDEAGAPFEESIAEAEDVAEAEESAEEFVDLDAVAETHDAEARDAEVEGEEIGEADDAEARNAEVENEEIGEAEVAEIEAEAEAEEVPEIEAEAEAEEVPETEAEGEIEAEAEAEIEAEADHDGASQRNTDPAATQPDASEPSAPPPVRAYVGEDTLEEARDAEPGDVEDGFYGYELEEPEPTLVDIRVDGDESALDTGELGAVDEPEAGAAVIETDSGSFQLDLEDLEEIEELPDAAIQPADENLAPAAGGDEESPRAAQAKAPPLRGADGGSFPTGGAPGSGGATSGAQAAFEDDEDEDDHVEADDFIEIAEFQDTPVPGRRLATGPMRADGRKAGETTRPLPPTPTKEITGEPRGFKAPPLPRDAKGEGDEPPLLPLLTRRSLGLKPTLTAPRFDWSRPFAPDGNPLDAAKAWWETDFDEIYLDALPATLRRQSKHEVDFASESLRLGRRARVLDLACGFGRHAIELSKRGHRVSGVDLSRMMLEKARAAAERAEVPLELLQGDMRRMDVRNEYHAAILLGQSFGYFDDRGNLDALKRIHRALKPGGRLFLETMNRDRVFAEMPRSVWWNRGGRLYLDEGEVDFEQSRLCVKRTVLFDDGRTPAERYLDMRLYSIHELEAMLAMAGFKVAELSGSWQHRGVFFPRQSRLTLALCERI
jgi:SAM-dependent methyltransferase